MWIKNVIKRFPLIRDIIAQRDYLVKEMAMLREQIVTMEEKLAVYHESISGPSSISSSSQDSPHNTLQAFPPGHFYSPIPCLDEIKMNENRIFSLPPHNLPGIDLNEEGQLETLQKLAAFYSELPWSDEPKPDLRFFFANPSYGYGDAIVSYAMLRYLSPQKLIEVGSGYSSAVTLDVNEIFFSNKIECTFIEPYPDLLISILKEQDKDRIKIYPNKLQDIELSLFRSLQENDILFIDSSHVSKINSDVNYEFFEILPNLNKGVYIHMHDVFYPFEYPKDWIYSGRAWNEDYILRSFLLYNDSYEIVQFNDFLIKFHKSLYETLMPICLKNSGGSIWLKKVK